ncbi:serine/threonine protein kinase [Streptomyces aquilus]|uniref:Serine/threonine protein kinase n=1 Tax=Streptomyces aquilus TaxID=2548456 RepID=A0A3Q9C2G8_9ACTN|nr:serine/threonine-protein kinase [Streptomyces aquilus]AZP19318.1 serine/threonine protein kinase [Streptomyces aquilus]
MQPLVSDDPSYIGPYRLIARLGSGGMGRVYLARSEGGRTVAVKLVHAGFAQHPGFRRRFAREVAAARKVGGEWTATVLDADTEAEKPWVATVYVPGPPLNAVVEGGFGPLPSASVHVLAHRLGLALQAIHEAGLVHRDLKPANILLTVDGPRIIDFGLARGYTASLGGSLTEPGAVLGTPAFMSPEQVRGETVSQASDVFSLGSVLTYAATGRLPFKGQDAGLHSMMFHIAYEDPDLDGVPEGLVDLVRQCLTKQPERRPSVRELLDRTRNAVARAWLPNELLVRLGRDVAWLLDAEVHLADDDPVTAVTVPPHAMTFPDVWGVEEDGEPGRRRDPLDMPEAGIRPPSVRATEPEPRPRRRRRARIGLAACALGVAGTLSSLPWLVGQVSAEGRDNTFDGVFGGGGWVTEAGAEGHARIESRTTVGKGSPLDFVVSGGRVTCWGRSTVLAREGDTLTLGTAKVTAVLPTGGNAKSCTPKGQQTLRADDDGTVSWVWAESEAGPTRTEFRLSDEEARDYLPTAYVGTWDSGRGLHLTIEQGDWISGRVLALDDRSGRHCVWSADVNSFAAGAQNVLIHHGARLDRSVSAKSCEAPETSRLTLSSDGRELSLVPYTRHGQEPAAADIGERLRRVM